MSQPTVYRMDGYELWRTSDYDKTEYIVLGDYGGALIGMLEKVRDGWIARTCDDLAARRPGTRLFATRRAAGDALYASFRP